MIRKNARDMPNLKKKNENRDIGFDQVRKEINRKRDNGKEQERLLKEKKKIERKNHMIFQKKN